MANHPPGQKRVFISHKSKDARWVRARLEGPLRDRGVSVSVFYEFDPKRERNENIETGIESSQYFLAVLTDYWFESPWCFEHEFSVAKSLGKTICAVLKEEIKQKYKDIFPISWIDLTVPETFTAGLERLFDALGVGSSEAGSEALPTPTAPYDPVGPPHAMSAVSLLPVECSDAPFDVGTIWGLSRVAQVGLLSAPAHIRILDTLVRAERAVLDAQFQGLADRVPDRWWVECSVTDHPNGPHTLDHIWTSAKRIAGANTAENPLSGYLRRCGLHPAMRFGCVLTVRDHVDDIRSVEQWCRRLVVMIPDVAIVIQIVAETLAASSHAALRLVQSLGQQFPVPVEAFEWRGSYSVASDAMKIVKTERRQSARTEVGEWLGLVLAIRRTTAAELVREVPVLCRIAVEIVAKDACAPRHSETIAALDEEAADPEAYGELLKLAAVYLPERMEDLLSACGSNRGTAAHRAAIVAASVSDAWMDAYVSGVDWQSPDAFDPLRFSAGERSCVDSVALALLRRFGRSAAPDQLLRQPIVRVGGWARSAIAVLCRAVLDSSSVIPAQGADPADWLDLARSGLPLGGSPMISEGSDVGWCWWLSATVPRIDAFDALVASPPERRAVFGFVTAADLDRIAGDATLLHDTQERRRRRSLPIRTADRTL